MLPSGFVKARHYGLLANRYREANLRVCRQVLLVVAVAAALHAGLPLATAHSDAGCPACGGTTWHAACARCRGHAGGRGMPAVARSGYELVACRPVLVRVFLFMTTSTW